MIPMRKAVMSAWVMVSAVLLIIVIWGLGLVTIRVGAALLGGVAGLWMMLCSRLLGIQKGWAWVMWGLGLALSSLGVIVGMWPLFAVAQLIILVAVFVLLATSTHSVPLPPLELTDSVKTEAGLVADNERYGKAFEVVLIDAKTNRSAVIRCLRKLYGIGLQRAHSIIEETPNTLQTAISKREADFVAARLAGCGAKVDIVKAQELEAE